MSVRITDILRQLPPGITEEDIVDMVDGDVRPEREALVIAALQSHPGLGLIVKQMRADRAAAEMLGEIAAPAGIFEGIESRLNNEALKALVSEADEVDAPIPISSVQPAQRGIIRIIAESAWSRRLATAASIAIVAGLGVVGARELARKWPRLPTVTPVVKNNEGSGGLTPESGGPGPGTTAIVTDDSNGSPVTPPAAGEPASTTTIAAATTDADVQPAGQQPLTAAQAIALAQEGRLVVTVRSAAYVATLEHLEGLSRATAGGDRAMRWRSHEVDKLPVELAALATPLNDPAAESRPAVTPLRQPPVFASERKLGLDSVSFLDAEPSPAAPSRRVVVKTVRMVRMNAQEQVLSDLLRDLNTSKTQVAEFRVLPSPLDVRPSLDAQSVLWWSAGASAWSPRVEVPIVVEVEQ